ncbi:sulfatase [Myxococcota bacterium]|nr:sulfatase [Myxococcota bacterium]
MPLSRRSLLAGTVATGAAAALSPLSLAGKGKPNVLFISIDDLNDWGGVLGGHPQAKTPFLDRLASRGVSFTNAHCPAPVCNPSRVAVLTGKRPSTSGVYDNHQALRRAMPDVATLPQHLRTHGYTVMGAGKVFHAGDPQSWDDYDPKDGCGRPPDAGSASPRQKDKPANGIAGSGSFDWGPGRSENDGKYSDDRVADQVIKWLKKDHDQPFFIAAGLFRPHLPWYVPQAYFDMYPLDRVVLPVVKPDDLDDVPEAGRRLARIADHERITKAGKWAHAVQAYLASLTFADAQLGRILDAVVDSDRSKDTIIVVWSDHGWSLGEKQHWKKFALWEECTRVPLVFKVPGLTEKGTTCGRPVGLIDLYPTLLDLCGVPQRANLDGQSLVPLLTDPGAAWERPALTTHGAGNHALRSERWRYIRYADGSEELYDHDADPNEWTNLAQDGRHAAAKAALAAWLPSSDAAPAPQGGEVCISDDD